MDYSEIHVVLNRFQTYRYPLLNHCEVQVCLEVNREWVSYYNGGIQLQSLLLFRINQIRITPSEWIWGAR